MPVTKGKESLLCQRAALRQHTLLQHAMTLWEFRHLNALQVNEKGLRFCCWMFRSATLKAVRIYLDPFMDMASQETPFPPVHSNLQILSTESVDAELGLLLMKCSFRSAAALLTNSHIYLCSLCEDLARGRSGGRICLMGLGLLTAACQNL